MNNKNEAKKLAAEFLNKTFLNESITEVLLDEKINIKQELYLGIMFDTSKRCPILIFSREGGVDVEELKERSPEKLVIKEINYLHGLIDEAVKEVLFESELSEEVNKETNEKLKQIMQRLYACFVKFDCRMLEINPLAVTAENRLIAVDAAAVLDDDARYRREIEFPERTDNRKATAREIAAHKIDAEDHRGVAGKTFVELDGDIAILTSGGGATMTLMDTLVEFGGKPANFTEYSGNPPREKVEMLTRIVLDREGLSGLLIAGVIANFTNIAETLRGVIDVLIEKKPKFPIVIRRAGPYDKEAKEMLLKVRGEHGLAIHYFDEELPMTKAAEIIVNLSDEYKSANEYKKSTNKSEGEEN